MIVCRIASLVGILRLAQNRHDVVDRDDVELVVPFEIDRNTVARVDQHLVVLADGEVGIVFDLRTDGDDPTGDHRYLGVVG